MSFWDDKYLETRRFMRLTLLEVIVICGAGLAATIVGVVSGL